MDCYADCLGDCAGGPSKEHYISESVLALAGKAVQVAGFPWQGDGESMEVGIGSLTAQVLCKHHNEELSPLDQVGKAFLTALQASHSDAFKEGNFTPQTFVIDGQKLELWLLKVLCGVTAIWPGHQVPESWVEILFQKHPFPENAGLYFFGIPGHAAWGFNLLRLESIRDKQGNIAGAKFGIGGLATLVGFGRPIFEEPDFQALYRPESLEIQKESAIRRFKFTWRGHEGKGVVKMRINGPVDLRSGALKPIVKKRESGK